ncbi:MAG TPA: AzlD domain-containing protein [Acidimicrobiales bacterium]|nr:AzlD domain-containing protein [Acidimicrobiales bacterium]
MTAAVLVGLTLGTYALKATAPLVLGGRALPPSLTRLADLMPAALLAALVVISTLTEGRAIVVDARTAGVLAGAVALARGAPFLAVVVLAAAVTAGVRLL